MSITSLAHQSTRVLSASALALLALVSYQAEAATLPTASVQLAWDAVPDSNLQGYRLHMGEQNRQYTQVLETTPQTVFRVSNLEFGKVYYFAVTAIGSNGLESGFSEELAVTLAAPQAIAVGDFYSTSQDVPLVIVSAAGVLANDTLTGAGPFTATVVSEPQHGSVSLNADGGFTYTPAAGYSGSDSFTYQADTGVLLSNIVSVGIIVNDATGSEVPLLSTPTLSGLPGARRVAMAAVPAGRYVLERSENLVDWEFVSEVQLTTPGALELEDNVNPVVPATSVFYRIGSTAFTSGN